MWTLETPIDELVIRAASIFVFVFVVMRLWGKKHLSQVSPFDLILMLIMSEAVQNALVDDDKSIPGGMITILVMVLLNIGMNKLSFKSKKAEKVFEGSPKIIILNGKIKEEALKELTLTRQELDEALRKQGVMKVDDVGLAMMETNGDVSVIKKEDTDFSNIPH